MPNEPNEARDINSGRPYKRAARGYKRKNWWPLPLPPKAKETPPLAYTGRGKPYPDDEQIDEWIERKGNGNICLRMGPVEVDTLVPDGTGHMEFDVVGIDVDDYVSGGKTKLGGKQLRDLERKLGKLPPTVRSTSRGHDNISGIRFYLAPAGHLWRGKIDRDIDIISPGYRYAVVWPSWHPEDRQYMWYDDRIAVPADGDAETVRRLDNTSAMPNPADLPHLPQKWFDFGTNEGMFDTGVEIDMDTGNEQMITWARQKLPKKHPDRESGMCHEVEKQLKFWRDAIDNEPSSHDKITNAHWNLVNLGKEGHPGWSIAVAELEKYYRRDTIRREKRAPSTVAREIWRSKINALRKVKAQVDKAKADGIDLLSTQCGCYNDELDSEGSDGQSRNADGVPIRGKGVPPPDEYERNDDGNAAHWLDLIGSENVHYVEGLGVWIFWSGTRWLVDENGLARRLFRQVQRRQRKYALQLNKQARAAAKAGNDDQAKTLGADAKLWLNWAEKSGNNANANAAVEAARAYAGITIDSSAVDARPHLLSVANGVIELHPGNVEKSWVLRPMEKTDLLTKSTNLPVLDRTDARQWFKDHPVADTAAGSGTASRSGAINPARGDELWKQYLATFLPDDNIQLFVQKVFGYCLLGDNRERLCVFLYGESTTGKTMLLEVVMAALGEYSHTVNLNIFKDRPSGLNPELAQAFPMRLVTASEVSGAHRMHADVFKRITGNEQMTAELKNQNTIIRKVPAFVPVIATNNTPTITGADAALKRRLCVIPFGVKIDEDDEDTSIKADLKQHGGPAVLRWLVEGWDMYVREGMARSTWPRAVRDNTSSFHSELSEIGMYEAERLRPKKGAMTSTSDLYADYQQWAIANGTEKVMDNRQFAKALSMTKKQGRIGPPGARGAHVRYIEGYELVTQARVVKMQKRTSE